MIDASKNLSDSSIGSVMPEWEESLEIGKQEFRKALASIFEEHPMKEEAKQRGILLQRADEDFLKTINPPLMSLQRKSAAMLEYAGLWAAVATNEKEYAIQLLDAYMSVFEDAIRGNQ